MASSAAGLRAGGREAGAAAAGEAQPPPLGWSEGVCEPSAADWPESSCFRGAARSSPGWDGSCRLEELSGPLREAAIPGGFVAFLRVSWANDAQKSVHKLAPLIL